MPTEISPMEYRDIIKRLRLGQKIHAIHRETGRCRKFIRKVKNLAQQNDWLSGAQLPTESMINEAIKSQKKHKPHPLDKIKDKIEQWVEQNYTYVVITELVNRCGFNYNEITIRRYIKKNFPKGARVVCRRSFTPGEVAEVDFGFLGTMYDEHSERKRKVYLFSMRLAYSRYCYRELVFTQQAEVFFQCHIHAFEYLGGVPHKVVCDNLKAGVIKASLQEPLINKSYRLLAEHYGFLISAHQPYRPQHKGGVEKDVDYVKRNFYPLFIEDQKQKGYDVPLVSECRHQLEHWTKETDHKHRIKYTDTTPEELFSEEKSYLLTLPLSRWQIVKWYRPKVSDDWHVQIECAFYSVPYQYIGKRVSACVDSQQVVIYYDYKQIACHQKARYRWQRVDDINHAPVNYQQYLNTTTSGVKRWAATIGETTLKLVEIILSQKSIDGLRPARAICSLVKKYGLSRLNNACQRALDYKLYSYHSVKQILDKGLDLSAEGEKQDELFDLPPVSSTTKRYKYSRDGSYFVD